MPALLRRMVGTKVEQQPRHRKRLRYGHPIRFNRRLVAGLRMPRPVITVPITGSSNDYVTRTQAAALLQVSTPYDTSLNVVGGLVRHRYSNGVTLGSTSTSTGGASSGSGWGNGWDWIDHEILSGTARIQGKGGVGGRGESLPDAFPINGHEGGGGGGGAGTQAGAGGIAGVGDGGGIDGDPGTADTGGNGGAGSALGGSTNVTATNGGSGGPALVATDGGPDHRVKPFTGATIQIYGGAGGGGGGASTGVDAGAAGGNGGGPGLAGSAGTGTGAGAGGSPGAAYSQPGSAVIVDAPVGGTIDKRGA